MRTGPEQGVPIGRDREVCCDYFRVTCAADEALRRVRGMKGEGVMGEVLDGVRAKGFRRIESWPRIGGTWSRRMEPIQASTRWGPGYESWEASSCVAGVDVESWYGKQAMPSRIDLTCDISGRGVRPFDVLDLIQAGKLDVGRQQLRRFETVGEGQTLYVGSVRSETMLRIYEKGEQTGTHEDKLRVEASVKGESAAVVWEVMQDKRTFRDGVASCWRSLLRGRMAGELVDSWTRGIEGVELKAPTADGSAWRTLAAVCDQYGPLLADLHAAGMLVPMVEAMREGSRMTRYRNRKVVSVLAQDVDRAMGVAKGEWKATDGSMLNERRAVANFEEMIAAA